MHALFEYDRAIVAGQKGDWNLAAQKLDTVLSARPDDAALLYDRGVAEYRLGSYEKAQTYFTHAAERAQDVQLKEQAFFNEGNAYMFGEQFAHAIDSYDRALEINPDDKQAQHNREIAKKLLQEQEQQQKEQSDNDNKDDNDQDQDQNKESSDSSDNTQQSDSDEKQQSDKQSSEQDKKQKDSKKNRDNNKDRTEDQKRQDNQKQSQDQKQQSEKKEHKQHDAPEKKQDKKDSSADKNNQTNAQEQPSGGQDSAGEEQKLEPWLAQLLDKQQEYDESMNKALIKAMVSESVDEYAPGQQNW